MILVSPKYSLRVVNVENPGNAVESCCNPPIPMGLLITSGLLSQVYSEFLDSLDLQNAVGYKVHLGIMNILTTNHRLLLKVEDKSVGLGCLLHIESLHLEQVAEDIVLDGVNLIDPVGNDGYVVILVLGNRNLQPLV